MTWQEIRSNLGRTWWGLILAEHEVEPTELFSALCKMVLGLQLIAPADTYARTPGLADLRAIPEWALGLMIFAAGMGHLLALRSGILPWRRAASGVACAIWLILWAVFIHASPASFVAWTFFLLFTASAWVFVRLGWLRP